MVTLEFEKPIVELEKKIHDLKSFTSHKKIDLSSEVHRLEEKLEQLKKEVYGNLSAWQRVQIARHPQRPYTLDYIAGMVTDFIELHGDRYFSDDKALITGMGKIDSIKCFIMGHQKGRDTKENLKRNFGCAHPEGYRKALRIMQLAEQSGLPVVILIDTPGAYPGIGAEERGQAQAIATNLREMVMIGVPLVAVVIGEGGSGGALGVGVADRVSVLENSYYSVISPEGCAAILWKSGTKAPEAAAALKLTGPDLLKNGLIDEIIGEPLGGAHRDHAGTIAALQRVVVRQLKDLLPIKPDDLLARRYEKFRTIGRFA